MTALIFVMAATGGFAHAGPKTASSIYDFSMTNIDSRKVNLKHYKGKVLLVVNVASKCGYTPQYAGLEQLYKDYKSQGFVILGFPANNFGEQEPGTNSEIKQFCTGKYDVTFPMFSKISVKGSDEADLYKWLIASSDRPNDDIEWNFTKFLIDKDGKVIKRFKSADTPESPAVKDAIEAALKNP
jgi:glutathione peroxidase